MQKGGSRPADFLSFERESKMLSRPLVKAIKRQCETLKQRDKAFNDLFSTAVSEVRQPTKGRFQLAE